MTFETAIEEARVVARGGTPQDTKKVEAELNMLAFDGNSLPSITKAKELIDVVSAIATRTGVDPGIRAAADNAMKRLMEELAEDEEEGLLRADDDKGPTFAQPAASDKDDDLQSSPASAKKSHVSVASAVVAASSLTNSTPAPSPVRRFDLLLETADAGYVPQPYQAMAMDAAESSVERSSSSPIKLGAKIAALTVLGMEAKNSKVGQWASELAAKAGLLHEPDRSGIAVHPVLLTDKR